MENLKEPDIVEKLRSFKRLPTRSGCLLRQSEMMSLLDYVEALETRTRLSPADAAVLHGKLCDLVDDILYHPQYFYKTNSELADEITEVFRAAVTTAL